MAESESRLGQTVSHYHIIEKLGRRIQALDSKDSVFCEPCDVGAARRRSRKARGCIEARRSAGAQTILISGMLGSAVQPVAER